jgi:hypothetical protein
MTDNKVSTQQKERRERIRWQIPKSVDSKVTIWTQKQAVAGQNGISEDCLLGCLVNICERGMQTTLDADCWGQLRTNQSVKIIFDISSSETEIKTEVNGYVRYILPDEQDNRILLGIEFSKPDLHTDTLQSISRICEFSGPCTEIKSGKCPNM